MIQTYVEEPEDPLSRDWQDRQRRRSTNEQGNRDKIPKRRPSFSGEEPLFRRPRVGEPGAIECYGIYVNDAATLLDHWGFSNEGLLTMRGWPKTLIEPGSPAIFLCPENIHGIYPTIVSLREEFRHSLSLSSNPALVNLRMILLHELGHHFFPVHRSGAQRFLSEALANLYCHRGLDRESNLAALQNLAFAAARILCISHVEYPWRTGRRLSRCGFRVL